jgi:hypothetical protein
MVVGTKTIGCGIKKTYDWGTTKIWFVEQKCMLVEQIYGCSNKNLWLW